MIRIPLNSWCAQAQSFTHDGFKQTYWTAGQGKPLLLIHGFPTSAWDWQAVWGELAQSRYVIAPDLLGFGLSDKPHPYSYKITEQAQRLMALLQALGVHQCDVLAHDYGDSVAQELITLQYEKASPIAIERVVFLNGGLFPETHKPLIAQRLLRSVLGPLFVLGMSKRTLRKSFQRIFGKHTQPSEEEIESYWQMITANNGKRVFPQLIQYMFEREQQRNRWLQAMNSAKVPMLLVNGVHDPISGAHLVKRYRELISNPHVHELASIGHYPHVEAPERVLDAVLSFVSSDAP